jgi:hypothetical protein
MRYARLFHGYPRDFFGFSDIPLSSLSLISLADPAEVVFAGAAPADFVELFHSWRRENAR